MSARVQKPLDTAVSGDLRAQIAEYYVSNHIVAAFSRLGGIPQESNEEILGIGFIDIVNYSRFTAQLSANDNQHILNGLYTALNLVLRQHGGYLNKIEGDSIMFQFGGRTDPLVEGMSDEEQICDVARRVFMACVQMQRFVRHFNRDQFAEFRERLSELDTPATDAEMATLEKAFHGVEAIKTTWQYLGREIDVESLFRVRIGATVSIGTTKGGMDDPFVYNVVRELLPDVPRTESEERSAVYEYIGEHSAASGNFGPEGARQWDILGPSVIEAKRLETTAPAGGLRISALLHKVLEVTKVARNYWRRFQHEAKGYKSEYRFATLEELFKKSTVVLEDKGNVTFDTYNVQVNARLPEEVSDQIGRYLSEETGSSKIVELLQYYRGILHVVNEFERALAENGIRLRKRFMIETMFPSQSEKLRERFGDDDEKIEQHIDSTYSLYTILERLDRFRDLVKTGKGGRREGDAAAVDGSEDAPVLVTHEQLMADFRADVLRRYDEDRAQMVQRAYFFNVVDPLVFESIRASIIECQRAARAEEGELEELEELEVVDDDEVQAVEGPGPVSPAPAVGPVTPEQSTRAEPAASTVRPTGSPVASQPDAPSDIDDSEDLQELEPVGELEELEELGDE